MRNGADDLGTATPRLAADPAAAWQSCRRYLASTPTPASAASTDAWGVRPGCTGPLDLHHGRVTARVERRHRSREFVALGVVYAVVASATARPSLSLNSHRWE